MTVQLEPTVAGGAAVANFVGFVRRVCGAVRLVEQDSASSHLVMAIPRCAHAHAPAGRAR